MTRVVYPLESEGGRSRRRTLTYGALLGTLVLLLIILVVSVFRSLTSKPQSMISPVPQPAQAAVLGEQDTTAIQKALVDSVAELDDRISSLENELFFASGTIRPASISSTGQNLLRNSSYESADGGKPRQWTYMYDSTSSNTTQSKEGIRSGSYGLKFAGGTSTGLDMGVSQPETETVPGRTYTLSLYLKHTNVEGETFIRLGFWDKYNNRFGPMKTIPIAGTKDWYRLSTTVTTTGLITDNANWYPMIEVRRLKDGSAVYIDDVQLEEGSTLTLYNSASAGGISNSFTSGIGDGSILGTPTGEFYPAQDGIGVLGTPTNRWRGLYLTRATINEHGDMSLEGDASIGGDLSVDGSASMESLTVNGTSTLKGNVTLGDSTSDTITVNGAPTFTGTSSFTGGITVGANGEFSINAAGDVTKINGVTYSFPTVQGALNEILINDGTGGLTWGTFGAASVTPDSLDFGQFKDAMAVDANTSVNLFSSSARTLRFFNSNTASDLLFLDGTTGRVGVGTQTPNAKLDVSGNIFPTTTLTHDVGSATYEWNNLYLGGTLDLGTNTVTDGTFTGNWGFSGGNLSNIGTISSGAITSTGTSLFANLATSGTLTLSDGTAASPALTFTNDTNTGVYRLDEDKIGLVTGGSPTQGIIVDGSGNVGMGTTTPGYKLDIAGSLNFTGTLNAGGSSGTLGQLLVSQGVSTPVWQDIDTAIGDSAFLQGGNTFGEAGVIGTDDNYALYFVTNGTEQMAITNTGNVGIGTTDPAATLEVAGNIVGSTISDGTVTITNGNITGAGTVTATSFSGSGSSLTDLNASNLASGTVPDARISGTYTSAITLSNALNSFTGSGAGLTSLNADNLASGTVPSGRLSGTYSIDVAGNATTATTLQTARTIAIGTGATGTATSFDGSTNITIPITAINADYLSSGTVNSARLSGAYSGITGVGILDAGSITSGFGDINIGSSIFTGNGSGLTALNASNLSTGTVPSGRLSGTYTIDIAGNASTATALQAARTFWGQSFDGTGNVSGDLSSVGNITGSGAITLAAGGADQNIRLTPSGTGYTILDGNVGIGTASPSYKLDVRGGVALVAGGSGRVYLADNYGSDVNQNSPKLSFWGNSADSNVINGPSIQKINTGPWGSGRLAFFQHDVGDYTNETEVLSILSDGSVGIGTTGPGALFEVRKDQASTTELRLNNDTLVGGFTTLGFYDGSTQGGRLQWDNDGHMKLTTAIDGRDLQLGSGADVVAMTLQSGGNVGIGYDSPGTAKLAINGNVGIGTTGPTDKLELLRSDSGKLLTLRSQAGNAGNVGMLFSIADNTVTTDTFKKAGIFFVGDNTSGARGDIYFAVDNNADSGNAAITDAKMVIKSAGNVGIGTTSPGAILDVYKNQAAGFIGQRVTGYADNSGGGQTLTGSDIFLSGNQTANIYGIRINIESESATPVTNAYGLYVGEFAGAGLITNKWGVYQAGTNETNYFAGTVSLGSLSPASKLWVDGGEVGFHQNNSSNDGIIWKNRGYQKFSAAIRPVDNGVTFARQGLGFFTGDSVDNTTDAVERMRISRSGNVGIGTTAPGYKLQVGMAGDGTEARANAWNTLSDQNLKEKISVIGSPLDVIEKLQGVKFNWKATGEESMGFIAQDLEKVLPQVVSTGADGYKSVNYPIMNALLVEGIKELNRKVDANIRIDEFGNTVQTTLPLASIDQLDTVALDTEVATLKDRLSAIEERLGEEDERDTQLASVSATLAAIQSDVEILKGTQFTASVSAALMGADLPVTDDETTLPNLIVTGHTNVYDLAVTGRITSGLLAIDGLSCVNDEDCAASISTLSGPLRIQELATGAVEIMAGKVVIDTNGDMKVEGKLTVGEVEAEKVKTKRVDLGNDVVFTSGDTAPTGTCTTGAVYIWNDKTKDEARMYVCTKKSWQELDPQ